MGAIETMKEAVNLIQQVDNIPLMKLAIDLQQQVYDLAEENRQLKERLNTREQLTFRDNAYWRGDEGPFCSPCWDSESKLKRLHVRDGYAPQCPSCKNSAVDPKTPPPKPSAPRISNWMSPSRSRGGW